MVPGAVAWARRCGRPGFAPAQVQPSPRSPPPRWPRRPPGAGHGGRPGPGRARQREQRRPHGRGRPRAPAIPALALHAMPVGTIRFGRGGHGRLTVRTRVSGLTPGSSTRWTSGFPASPGSSGSARSPPAAAARPAASCTATSAAHCGAGAACWSGWGPGAAAGLDADRRDQVAGIPATGSTGSSRSRSAGGGTSYGTPHGRATVAYNASRQTLTVTVHASGVTPGPHAAHIHLGSCMQPGPGHIHAAGPGRRPPGPDRPRGPGLHPRDRADTGPRLVLNIHQGKAAISSATASRPSTSGRCCARTSATAVAVHSFIGEPNRIRFPSGSMCAPSRSWYGVRHTAASDRRAQAGFHSA